MMLMFSICGTSAVVVINIVKCGQMCKNVMAISALCEICVGSSSWQTHVPYTAHVGASHPGGELKKRGDSQTEMNEYVNQSVDFCFANTLRYSHHSDIL